MTLAHLQPPAGVTPQLEAAKAREKVLGEQAQLLEGQLAAAEGKVGAGLQGRLLLLLQALAGSKEAWQPG